MKVGSLFAGIGGFDLAAERVGMQIAWQSELDPHASRVLAHHWPDVPNLGDIHDITEPPTVDVLTGGFPCQDYSVAGNRAGLAGDRGALWWQMHRIVAQLRPTWIVGENVPGLLSSRGGADFETIIRSLTECGYGVAWAVLDAQYFGVAQRRRRVFIVGHSGGVPRPEILALSEGLYGHPAPSRETGEGTAADVATSLKASGTYDHVGDESKLIAGTIRSEAPGSQQGGTLLRDGFHVRRLTPLECERLQGFPDHWTAVPGNSDTQRYRQLGNAVAVPVVEWILGNIVKAAPHDRPAPSPRPRETPPQGWGWDHESSPSTERDAPMDSRGPMTPSGPGR